MKPPVLIGGFAVCPGAVSTEPIRVGVDGGLRPAPVPLIRRTVSAEGSSPVSLVPQPDGFFRSS